MDPYVVLVCPACGAKTSVRSDEASVVCDYCGNNLILRPELRQATHYAAAVQTRPAAPMPKNLSLAAAPDGFTLTRRWFSLGNIFLTIFVIIWDGFLLFWFGGVAAVGAPPIFFIFPLLHVAVGILLTYTVLAGYLNTTEIRLAGSLLSITHGPLPWPGNTQIPVTDLDQLYTREVVQHSENGSTTSYILCAVLKNGRALKLVKSLPDAETSLFIEQQIESSLGIQDRPVAGEIAR